MFYALDLSGNEIAASKCDKSYEGYRCPYCGEIVRAATSGKGNNFFRHLKGDPKSCLLRSEDYIRDNERDAKDRGNGWHKYMQAHLFPEAETEVTLYKGERRADIVFSDYGRKVVIEIQHSSIDAKSAIKRTDQYCELSSNGKTMIWIFDCAEQITKSIHELYDTRFRKNDHVPSYIDYDYKSYCRDEALRVAGNNDIVNDPAGAIRNLRKKFSQHTNSRTVYALLKNNEEKDLDCSIYLALRPEYISRENYRKYMYVKVYAARSNNDTYIFSYPMDLYALQKDIRRTLMGYTILYPERIEVPYIENTYISEDLPSNHKALNMISGYDKEINDLQNDIILEKAKYKAVIKNEISRIMNSDILTEGDIEKAKSTIKEAEKEYIQKKQDARNRQYAISEKQVIILEKTVEEIKGRYEKTKKKEARLRKDAMIRYKIYISQLKDIFVEAVDQ